MKNVPSVTTNLPKNFRDLLKDQSGRAGWIFLWLIGVPIPVLFFLFLLRGCT